MSHQRSALAGSLFGAAIDGGQVGVTLGRPAAGAPYGLVMICKNESAVIRRALESAVSAGIAYWTILDTGSDDGTQAIIRDALVGIPGNLVEAPFVDFGTSRSEAFRLAHGTAGLLLCLDADMTIEVDPGFVPDPAVDAYLIEMGTPDFSYRLPLLLDGRREWKSVGAVHEFTCIVDGSLGVRVPTDKVRITHHGEGRASREKSEWQLGLLEREWESGTNSARTAFYIAQTLSELGRTKEAIDWYDDRVAMGGWVEETYVAALRAARLTIDWPERRDRLWVAWQMRPSRLEAPYSLARGLNEHDDHSTAYAVASVPSGPSEDILFVDAGPAAWGLQFERSIAAYYVGRYAESQALGHDLLTRELPPAIRAAVERNLEFGPRE